MEARPLSGFYQIDADLFTERQLFIFMKLMRFRASSTLIAHHVHRRLINKMKNSSFNFLTLFVSHFTN